MADNRPPHRGSTDNVLNQRRNTNLPNDLYRQLNAGKGDGNDRGISGKVAGRPTFTEIELDEVHELPMSVEEQKSRRRQLEEQRKAGKEVKDFKAVALGIATRMLPCIKVFMNYKPKEYAVFDLLSGLSVGLFAIPQAIAFALLANVKPQYGFYSAFFAMAIYFIFGSSSHLNMTHQGAVSLLVGENVRAGVQQVYAGRLCEVQENATATPPIANATAAAAISGFVAGNATVPCIDPDEASIMVSVTLTMVVGALQLTLGFLRFGFITIYFSDPLNSAFTCGAALHILSSQLANMLGTTFRPITGYAKFFLLFYEAFQKLFVLDVNAPTIFIFLGFFIALLAVKLINERCSKYVKIPIPIDIIVLVSSLLLSRFLEWNENLKVEVVGDIPRGFEAPRAPQAEHFTSETGILINGIVLGIIGYSLSVSVAKTFAMRHGYEVDANQEMIAYGAVNFGMSWFNTFASASSIACTSLHESMRGKTLFYTVYAVLVTLLGILVLAPEFAPVPKCVLSAIIIVNLKNMMLQFEQLPGLWRTNKYDFSIWIVTLAAILGFDLPTGLLVGVVYSLATVIFRSQAPKAYLMGRVPSTDIYKNIKKNRTAEEIEGVKIFKFDGSLYFASAENFRQRLYRQVAMNPKKILVKAQALAQQEGDTDDAGIRTDVMLRSEDVKLELERVQREGQAGDSTARRQAQHTGAEAGSSHDHHDSSLYDNDDDTAQPTVNVFCIILDLAACAFTDAVGIRLLKQIVEDFGKIGVDIYVSGCSSLVRSQLRKGDFFKKRDETGVFVTVHDAVLHALSKYYKELLEEEQDEENGDQNGAAHSGHRSSIVSTGSDAEARETRRMTRKISRQRNPDEMLHQYRKVSESVRNNEQQQKNRYDPDALATPVAAHDDDDNNASADADHARLSTLPDDEPMAQYDNAGYAGDVDTEL